MAIKGIVFPKQKVSAAEHAALFRMVINDGVLDGCGDSFALDTLTINSGSFILAGRMASVVGSESIHISTAYKNKRIRIRGVIDLNQASEVDNFNQFYFSGARPNPSNPYTLVDPDRDVKNSGETFGALIQEDVNFNGKIYEVEWGVATTDSNGVITAFARSIPEAIPGEGYGGGKFIEAGDFTYNGGSETYFYSNNIETEDWEIIITAGAENTLTFLKPPGAVDIFMVSAGFDGEAGANSKGGDGGNGGATVTLSRTVLKQGGYSITIGTSDSSDSSTPDTSIKTSGESADVIGSALRANSTANNAGDYDGTGDARKGADGVLAFGDDGVINTDYKNRKYAAGGGAGGKYSGNASTGQWTGGPAAADGGIYGGGKGHIAPSSSQNNLDAKANSGSGGGGGSYNVPAVGNGYHSTPGKGGSGIMIIRRHKENAA